jgi:ligand-binding sensor domain-containing protein
MKIKSLIFIFAFFPCLSSFPIFQQIYSLEDAYIKRVGVSSLNPYLVCVASKNSLYISNDGAKTFKKLSVFKDEEIVHLFFDNYLANIFYVVTTRHLYEIRNTQLKRLFSSPEKEIIYTAAKNKGNIFIGTSKGAYYAQEDVLNWKRLKKLQNTSVYYIEPKDDKLYLATSRGVYIFRDQTLKRVFVIRESEEKKDLIPNMVKVDIFDSKKVWLGTTGGLFLSSDGGNAWNKLYLASLGGLSVRCITQTKLEKDTIYLATSKGFFKIDLKTEKVTQLFEGLPTNSVNWITITSSGEILLATDKGLFKNNYFTFSYSDSLKTFLKKEPSIEEIQQAALKYNEVHPDKIRKWRKALKLRALFPQISLDYDKTINYDSGADRYYVGPRDWGISFTWNIADLLWNPYEDNVDTRSRLTTQLRLDILDEINRVYFERLRLKQEILSSNLSGKELFDKKLRLKELTAILDGYTGGYFSRRLKELNNNEK